MERLCQRWSQLALPLYAHYGGADRCTSLPATAAFVQASASEDKVGGRPLLRGCSPGGLGAAVHERRLRRGTACMRGGG